MSAMPMKMTRDAVLSAYIRWCEGENIRTLAKENGVSLVCMRARLEKVQRLVLTARKLQDGELVLRWASRLPRLPLAETKEEREAWDRVVGEAHEREDAIDLAARWRNGRRQQKRLDATERAI